jgi:uncharacterized protein YraI
MEAKVLVLYYLMHSLCIRDSDQNHHNDPSVYSVPSTDYPAVHFRPVSANKLNLCQVISQYVSEEQWY